jgi:hypothetical protein
MPRPELDIPPACALVWLVDALDMLVEAEDCIIIE